MVEVSSQRSLNSEIVLGNQSITCYWKWFCPFLHFKMRLFWLRSLLMTFRATSFRKIIKMNNFSVNSFLLILTNYIFVWKQWSGFYLHLTLIYKLFKTLQRRVWGFKMIYTLSIWLNHLSQIILQWVYISSHRINLYLLLKEKKIGLIQSLW